MVGSDTGACYASGSVSGRENCVPTVVIVERWNRVSRRVRIRPFWHEGNCWPFPGPRHHRAQAGGDERARAKSAFAPRQFSFDVYWEGAASLYPPGVCRRPC
jgi:hypothetical protein